MGRAFFLVVFTLCTALAVPARAGNDIPVESYRCNGVALAFSRLVHHPQGDLSPNAKPRLLKLVGSADPVLRRVAAPVSRKRITEPDMQQFFDDMIHTMNKSGGVGLAGPQVGFWGRVAVIMGPEGPLVIVNPTVEVIDSTALSGSEGCLSLPGVSVNVTRPKTVRVSFIDRHGRDRIMDLAFYAGRIAQHEVDHLNGVLITDYRK